MSALVLCLSVCLYSRNSAAAEPLTSWAMTYIYMTLADFFNHPFFSYSNESIFVNIFLIYIVTSSYCIINTSTKCYFEA